MANYKISGLTAYPNSTFAATDKFEVSYLSGGVHYSRYLTGTQLLATIPSGLTIGTTAITSGTTKRVMFQDGSVVSQSANLLFDSALRRLQIIATTGGGGADVPLLIRNSADTLDLVKFRANGDHVLGSEAGASLNILAKSGYSYPTLNLSGQGGTEKAGIRQTSNRLTFLNTTSDTATATITTNGLAVGFGDVGATAKLDVKCGGALSTDLGFRVRNSADTANIFSVQGDGTANILSKLSIGFSGMTTTGGALFVYAGNSGDYMSRFFNTAGVPIIDFRTNSDGGEITIKDHLGAASITLSGRFSNALDFANSKDIGFGTGGGTKIGYATNQKFAFWNATPIVQPTTSFASATLVSNLGTPITSTDTFDGYTLLQLVKILRTRGDLA